MRRHKNTRMLAFAIATMLMISGCGETTGLSDIASGSNDVQSAPREATASVLVPTATGDTVYTGDGVTLDISKNSDGYVMLNYNGEASKVKFRIETPAGETYTYTVTRRGEYQAYPLSSGDGTYTFSVYESVADSAQDDMYAVALCESTDVSLVDEYAPFLYPNCYVDFTKDSECVKLAETLSSDCSDDLAVVEAVFSYVTENITYDDSLAAQVSSGDVQDYVPSPDSTLSSGKGICFDYSSLMSAMLRCERIPARLVMGYANNQYHAWISCYVDEVGWVDDIISFDGKTWTLMDPTFAAGKTKKQRKKLAEDYGSYIVKYVY